MHSSFKCSLSAHISIPSVGCPSNNKRNLYCFDQNYKSVEIIIRIVLNLVLSIVPFQGTIQNKSGLTYSRPSETENEISIAIKSFLCSKSSSFYFEYQVHSSIDEQ